MSLFNANHAVPLQPGEVKSPTHACHVFISTVPDYSNFKLAVKWSTLLTVEFAALVGDVNGAHQQHSSSSS